MCCKCATASSLRARHGNTTTFRPGPDSRRHRFSIDECRRGGRISWARTMVQLRRAMNLPISSNIIALAELPF